MSSSGSVSTRRGTDDPSASSGSFSVDSEDISILQDLLDLEGDTEGGGGGRRVVHTQTICSTTSCKKTTQNKVLHLHMSLHVVLFMCLLCVFVVEIDLNLYRGFSPLNPRWARVYGGQTVSQALVAACCTVGPAYTVHSLHSYFLRPGSNDIPILYAVDRLRDGRSFCTRRVIALQHGRAIFVMSVSFHTQEAGFEHQDPFPENIPAPDTLPSYTEVRVLCTGLGAIGFRVLWCGVVWWFLLAEPLPRVECVDVLSWCGCCVRLDHETIQC